MESSFPETFRSPLSVSVLFQDNRVLAVHKPEGQLVIPGRAPDTIPCLKDECLGFFGRPVFVVHRIDRETSGIVLFALDPDAHRFLCRAFERREVRKEYRAVVQGEPNPTEGVLSNPLREFGSGRVAPDPRGKPSRTEYQTLARWSGGSLLAVRPVTGRRHQIRTHLAGHGHPVLGDPLYGPAPRPIGGVARLMLHASVLQFPHPEGGTRTISCGPPNSFIAIFDIVSKPKIVYLGRTGGTTQ